MNVHPQQQACAWQALQHASSVLALTIWPPQLAWPIEKVHPLRTVHLSAPRRLPGAWVHAPARSTIALPKITGSFDSECCRVRQSATHCPAASARPVVMRAAATRARALMLPSCTAVRTRAARHGGQQQREHSRQRGPGSRRLPAAEQDGIYTCKYYPNITQVQQCPSRRSVAIATERISIYVL